MAYQDPYTSHRAAGSSSYYTDSRPQQPYAPNNYGYSDSYPPYQPYDPANASGGYDAYGADNIHPHATNRHDGPYRDDQRTGYNEYPSPQRSATQSSKLSTKNNTQSKASPFGVQKEASGFDTGEFTPKVERSRSARALREYRYDHQGNLWTKGGCGRCAGRVCCCTLMTTVFLIVSVVLALALWVRPPSITIGNVQPMTVDGQTIQSTANGLEVNLGVNISVRNPNYFSVDFKKIEADITYPPNNFPIGNGVANDILFKSRTETNFTFPFVLNYNSTLDTGNTVILDIAQKCGAIPGFTKSNIIVNYKITLGIRILIVTISPVISNQFNFPCPLSASDIQKFLGGGT